MTDLRHDWTNAEALSLYTRPFADLLYRAQTTHRAHFDANEVQLSTLLNIKAGGCPEDCGYCSQSTHHQTPTDATPLLDVDAVLEAARAARAAGATRFCMGAAWRQPRTRDMPFLARIVGEVKALGLETCLTLGMLTRQQAAELASAGLDYYNHNLDTSPEFYGRVVTTRTYQDRLETLGNVRDAGISVCSGGILGMGETAEDRVGLLVQLANLPRHPDSVPINLLVQVEGTPLWGLAPLDPLDLVRTIAVARLMMPRSVIRLSAGREALSDETHALAFLAGANSVFYGERLLTTANSASERDESLFARLGVHAQVAASAAHGRRGVGP
jgi:biotin synthase